MDPGAGDVFCKGLQGLCSLALEALEHRLDLAFRQEGQRHHLSYKGVGPPIIVVGRL